MEKRRPYRIQRFYETTRDQRPALLGVGYSLSSTRVPRDVLQYQNAIVRRCLRPLEAHGISALARHGDLEQRDRDQVLVRFANRSCRVLVATDVAARGLDIKELELVVNYELAFDPEVMHRISRTGRAGMSGLAISLCTPQEMARAHAIEDYLQNERRLVAGVRAERAANGSLRRRW